MSDLTPKPDEPRLPADDSAAEQPVSDELPPLPDGGLGTSMPSWLQQAPSRPTRTRPPETIDLASLTTGIEVPEWLRDLSRRVEAGSVPPSSDEERPLAEAIVEHAPEVGEPEPALSEPESEAATVRGEASAESQAVSVTVEPAEAESDIESNAHPEPALRFQVRSGTPAAQEPDSGAPDPAPRPASRVKTPRTSPAPEPPRSMGATLLLLLLLIALAAVGVWYYWM